MIVALQTLVFFRESLLGALNRLLSPYYKSLRGTFIGYSSEEEEEDEEVFADFDEEKGVVFYPPVYLQRYAAVSDCLMDERWSGKLAKVVDLGYHDMSFIKYLKDLPGVECIFGVDIESIPLRCSSVLLDCEGYAPKRENPLQVTLFQGNAADPDYRLIGCDAVVAIEMIEHMLPHDLERLVHTIFGFIKPWVAVITTPNGDFNELFKALEKNGLRRLDHFFEWSREQFHDWCSNIVARYPQFTVTCQGVGPGPPGTGHLGCCSQLALFVNKSYVKQQDLNINSLALVSNVPSPHNFSDIVNGFESPVLNSKENAESITDLFPNKQSLLTLIISQSSPALSVTTIEHHDKTSQCNLDTENSKNFLMFDYEDMCYTILMPRRKVDHRVYEIEDVNSRLNCTTFQARKFSKATQNLMAKNRIDSLAHTREVVSEIRHLTKMLNFNKDSVVQRENGHIWCNINWGENAPFWNEYFKVVKDYNYPFEHKSEESKILDLILEEINRVIDMHCDEESSSEVNKLPISIEHLMRVVRHITSDVEKVKDLLEWNGYEVEGDYVIHSRLLMDTSIASTEVDWPEPDTTSELDTIDGQTTISEASAIVPDFYGRSLHRALDKKVQALRTMLLVDEDIASELDRVVCRLMRLALLTSNGKQEPPPPKWMQCKLLDLLTLTEKAITRRKKHFIDNFPLKSISFDKNITILNKMIKEDQAARMIVDKYNHLLQEAENQENFNDLNFGFEDEISEQLESNECLKDFALDDIKYTLKPYVVDVNNGEISNIEDNLEIAYPDHITSDSSNGARKKYVKEETRISRKRSYTKITGRTYKPEDKNSKSKKSKTNVFRKKPVRAKTSNSFLIMKGKKVTNEYGNYGLKSRRVKTSKNFEPTASKPIPGSLIELCEPRMNLLLHSKNFQYTSSAQTGHDPVKNPIIEVAATEESVLIDIVMDDMEETIALRRSIGTDADNTYLTVHEQEATLGNVTNVTRNSSNKQHVSVESIQSETIFLYDINEPSTSKGIRHNVSMDVQCGTDAILPTRGLVTPLTSPMKLPKLYSGGIKIDSMTNFATEKKSVDFGTCTISVTKNCNTCYTPCMFPKGIEIEDLQHNLKKKVSNIGTSTADAINECKLPLTHSSRIRLKDSFNDMSAERFSHFNMITCEENDQWLPKSATMKSSGTMTEIISENDGYGTRRSVSPEELTSITPRTKSHDLLTSSRMDDSLSNLLVNFYETDARHTGSRERFPNARSRSPDAVYTSPDAKNRSPAARYRSPDAGYRSPDARNRSPARKTSFNARNRSPDLRHKSYYACGAGIKIKDSATDTRNLNKVNCSTSTIGDSKTNKIFSRPESPVVYTRVKMIDLISNVTIEQDTEIEPFGLPEPCKLVSSTYIPERPPECRFKIKNSSHVKHSLTRDIDTCIDNSNEKLDNKAHKYTKDEHSNDKTENHDYDTSGTVITNDSFTKVPMKSVNLQADFFDKNASALPLTQSFGFKVKGFDENVIKKVEFSATRVELVSETANFWPPTQLGSSTKTELLKAVSSRIKVEDSASELYGSNYCPSPKSLWQGTISTLNSKQSLSRDMNCHSKESPTKLTRCKLSCGGVHIHSFKEKQISEDVVYQGEWKRHVPKYPRKYQGNTIVAKKVSETSKKNRTKLRQEKLQVKKVEIKNEHIKPLQVRNTNPARIKRDVNNKCEQIKKVALPNLANVIKENRKTITKVASKIMTSTPKNIKSMRLPKKLPNHVTLTPFVKNDFIVKSEPIKTNDLDYKYLPTYLRRRKSASGQSKQTINNIIDTNKTTIINEDNTKNDLPSLARSKSELIQSDLLKLQDETFSSTNYLVFRNEKENTNPPANSSQSADITNTNETTITRKSIHKRLSNPISPTSSACSTSDSISTVRATNNWTGASRRRSTSSNKSSMANTDSETSPSANKTRKFSKKSKANKKSDGKDHNNKENVPESSKKRFPEKGICLQNMKSAFMGRNKNIFMAKLNDSGLALSEKHKNSTKSNIKTPAIEVNDDKKRLKSSGFSKKLSNDSITKEYVIRNHDSIQFDASNKVLLIEPLKDHVKIQENISQHVTPEEQILKVVDSQLLTEWFERGKVSVIDRESTENAILAQMRQLVEERLDFIATSLNDSSIELEDNSSLKSYKTMVPAEDTDLDSSLKSEIENAMNHSLDAVLGGESDFSMQKQSSIDFDLISFQSLASTSRYSDYYLAESNISKNEDNTENINVSSVLDIFERKDLNALVQNAPGPLAVQAFSGFSMNVDHVMGDQPDYIPVMDSQTGSLAVTRQTTSEEMFVSERSSETYESCTLEEEVSVPDWLFHVMNPHLSMESDQHPDLVAPFDSETGSPARGYSRPRHQTINEEEDQELLPLRMPLVEPVLDENGNVMEPGIGLGAGAGDGRGMHSDHSQDSSGRGSSLSSTDASSGQQSEAVLIDPSAFTTQFEMFHEPVGSSMAVTTLVVPARSSEADRQHGRNEGAIMSTSRNATIRTVHPPLTSSDGEADVSSLDTDDIPDSS